MNIVLSVEEIAGFPAEINEFLGSYVARRLSRAGAGHSGNLRVIKDGDDLVEAVQGKEWDEPQVEHNWDSKQLKNPHRPLLNEPRFDWYKPFEYFLKKENRPDSHFGDHDFIWVVDGDYVGFPDQPLSEDFGGPGVALLFLALFGFGGRLEGIGPALTPKDFIDNARKVGVSVKNYRSAGPLLKSITTYIRNVLAREEYCKALIDVTTIHWFDLEKKTNRFYFPENTKEACMRACQKLFDEYISEPTSFINQFDFQLDIEKMKKYKITR